MLNQPLYSVRYINDLKDMVQQSENLFGSKNAFYVKASNNDSYIGITYSQFKNDIDYFGTALINLGLKNNLIAVISENRYEWCVTYLATVNGTGVIVPLDKELPLSEIENLLGISGASTVVFSGKYAEYMEHLAGKLPFVKYFIHMDLEEDKGVFLSYKKLVKKGRELVESGNQSFTDACVDREGMSILLFTSGTTDLAKGVMLSHKNLCSNIMATCSVLYLDSSDSILSILPLHHTYECTNGFLLMIYNGCTISFNEGLKHITKNLKETQPTILLLVPLILENMYKKILEQAGKKKGMKMKLKAAMLASNFLSNMFSIDLTKKLFKQIHENIGGRVRLVISGAAAIDPAVVKGFRSLGIRVLQGYGLTECSPIVSVNTDQKFKADSIGPALPGVDIRIDHPDRDGVGEIVVKGDSVMLGYFTNDLATSKVLKGGWFYTGDLGRLDDRGFLYITGRKKSVIVTKNGKNIFPEEVETYLNKSPFIMESLICGKLDEASGETFVTAQIVPDIEVLKQKLRIEELSNEDVHRVISAEVKNINKTMPLYKRIKQFTIREEEFAKTTTRKIKRYVEKTG